MLAIKLLFCFAAALAVFTEAKSSYTPDEGIKFTCSEVCYGHLRGKTYSCDLYSPRGMVTTIVRMVNDLSWRIYVIPRIRPEIRFCQRVAAADEYFESGKTSCSSFGFCSNSEDTEKIDPSTLQSSLRLEDLKRLLKEINNDSTEVLNDLKNSSENKGFRSIKPTLFQPMKIEIKIVLEKLKEHLSLVGGLNDDVKYHVQNASSDGYPYSPNPSNLPHIPSPSSRPRPQSHPTSSYSNLPNRPSRPGSNSFSNLPSMSNRPDFPSLSSSSNLPSRPSSPNFSNLPGYPSRPYRPGRPFPSMNLKFKGVNIPYHSHNFDYNDHNKEKIWSHNDHNLPYNSDNYYSRDLQYETRNTYNVDSNNDQFPAYNDGRNYGSLYSKKYRGKRSEDVPKVDQVKELASELKEESSTLSKELDNGSLPEDSEKKRSLVNHLTGLTSSMNNVQINQSNTYLRAEDDKRTEFTENSTTDSKDSSQSVEKHALRGEKSDSDSNKRKFTHDTSDEHGECLLCTTILKDLCNDRKIVVCNEAKCCWRDFNPYHCMTTLNDNRSITCYNSLFNIILSAKM